MPPNTAAIPLSLTLLIAAMSSIGPFAIDTYLPAFRAMATDLSASQIEIQQTLTAYMLAFAGMALWHGALADRYGRRPVLIGMLLVFAVASLLCAMTTRIEWLWAGRALQGLAGGAGMILGRAIVRDLYDGAQAQRLMARTMAVFALAPAIAPVIGGFILKFAGWRAIFVFLALFASVLAWQVHRRLPETLADDARQSLNPANLLRGYRDIFTNPRFVLLSLAGASAFNGFFVYVMSAPMFVMTHLGLSETDFGWLFGPITLGMIAGASLSSRFAGRLSAARVVATGFVLMAVAAAWNILASGMEVRTLPWVVLPLTLYNVGLALVLPIVSLFALDLFPARRGMASSCQSFLQTGINATLAGAIVPLVWGSLMNLALTMVACLALGYFMLRMARRA